VSPSAVNESTIINNDDETMASSDSDDDDVKKIKVQCPVCINTFTTTRFKNHECDTSTLIPCKKCMLHFMTRSDVEQHDTETHKTEVKKGNRSKLPPCVHCDRDYESVDALEEHLRKVGCRLSPPIFNCKYCTKFYTDEIKCMKHMQMKHQDKKLKKISTSKI
jgi:hypothetical protein